jgi:hypothetical protein
MKVDEIRKMLHNEPFRHFVIVVADGGRIPVLHEDFVAVAPTGREMIVYQPDGSYNVVDTMLVTRLEVEATDGRRKTRK